MSYDIAVFEPNDDLRDRATFLAWFKSRTQWGPRAYDPTNATSRLRSWFNEMIETFPPMNTSNRPSMAYIRAKTTISIVLACGGLLQTIVGAVLLNAGLNDHGTASFSLMGAKFSATGLGGIVLCTSALWAFLAYRASPKYSRTSESKNSTNADGSTETYVYESATQFTAKRRR